MSIRRSNPLVAAVLLSVSIGAGPGCGGSTAAGKPGGTEAAGASTAGAATTVNTHPVQALPPLPAKVERLLDIVPRDATVVAHVHPAGLITASLDGKTPALSRQTLAAALSEASDLPISFTGELWGALDEAVYFTEGPNPDSDSNLLRTSCVGGLIQDEQRFDTLIDQLASRRRPDGYLESKSDGVPMHGAWIASSRVAVLCSTADLFEQAMRTAKGAEPSFRASPRFRAESEQDTWASVDVHQLSHGDKHNLDVGSYLSMTLPRNAPANVDLHFVGHGDVYPRWAEMIGPTNHQLLGQFPEGATLMLGLSLDRSKGKTMTDVLDEIERSGARGEADAFRNAVVELGTNLQSLDTVLGKEIAIAIYASPKFASSKDDFTKNKALLLAIPTTSEAAGKKTWASMLAMLKGKIRHDAKYTAESMTVNLRKDNELHIERKSEVILVSAGDKAFAAELRGKYGNAKLSVAANADFEKARQAALPAHLMGYVDTLKLLHMAGENNENMLSLAQAAPQFATLTLAPMERGLDLTLRGQISTFGVTSALAIYGVNRYLKAAKTAEAKNTVGRISRAAVEAFEREGPNGEHILCKSARPVPAKVPAARKYMPSADAGMDFHSGTVEEIGWRCLRIDVDMPMYYQYDYRMGGNYKGPARGGPDPGPNGYEVSAEGDLDGDGKTSLFTLVGQVKGDMLERATQIFVVDEFE